MSNKHQCDHIPNSVRLLKTWLRVPQRVLFECFLAFLGLKTSDLLFLVGKRQPPGAGLLPHRQKKEILFCAARKKGEFMGMGGVSCKESQARIKLARPFPAPELRVEKLQAFYDNFRQLRLPPPPRAYPPPPSVGGVKQGRFVIFCVFPCFAVFWGSQDTQMLGKTARKNVTVHVEKWSSCTTPSLLLWSAPIIRIAVRNSKSIDSVMYCRFLTSSWESPTQEPPPSPFWAVNADHGLSFAGQETWTMV